MHPKLDDSRYAHSDSWWNPRFIEPGLYSFFLPFWSLLC